MTDLEQMCRDHFNEPIISANFEVVRCIGYAEDEMDCYIITLGMQGKKSYHTCVGGYVFLDRLRGQQEVKATNGETWDDFFRLDSALALNGSPKQERFVVEMDLKG